MVEAEIYGATGRQMKSEDVRNYWTRQAQEHGRSSDASWSDRCVIDLEIAQLLKRVPRKGDVLDIGCANGHTTLALGRHHDIQITGVDYIPEMIAHAWERLQAEPSSVQSKIRFEEGDIRKLRFPDSSFDSIVVVRVLINLSSEEEQIQALRECARLLRSGGTLFLSEASLQGWNKLNDFRREWGLGDIPMPSFNRYLDENRIFSQLPNELKLREVVHFASSYFVGTRVFKPLLAKLAGKEELIAEPLAHFNRWCAEFPTVGDYGTQRLFVLERTNESV